MKWVALVAFWCLVAGIAIAFPSQVQYPPFTFATADFDVDAVYNVTIDDTKWSTDAQVTSAVSGALSDTAFASSWNGVTTVAPTKNAVYDWGHIFDTDDDGKVNVLDQGAGVPQVDSGGVIGTPLTADGRSLTITSNTLDADSELYTEQFTIAFKAIAATDDVLFGKVAVTMTPTGWDCVAQGGSGLTTVDVSLEECNTAGASCAGIGATATMTAVDTNVSDASYTDTTLTAANWLKVVVGTVTWTTPGFVTCTLKATLND